MNVEKFARLGQGAKNAATGLAIAAAVALAVWLGVKLYRGAKAAAGAVVDTVSTDLNPANSGNLVNRGVEAVGGALTGEGSGFSLGGWVHELTHSDTPPAVEAQQVAICDAYLAQNGFVSSPSCVELWNAGKLKTAPPAADDYSPADPSMM